MSMSMSVIGFQKKVWMEGGWALSNFFGCLEFG